MSRYPWPPRKEIPEVRAQEVRGRCRPHAESRLWKKETGVTETLKKGTMSPQAPPASPTPRHVQTFSLISPAHSPTNKTETTNTHRGGFHFQGLWKMRRPFSHEPAWPCRPETAPAAAPFPLRYPQGQLPGSGRREAASAGRTARSDSVTTAPSRPEAATSPRRRRRMRRAGLRAANWSLEASC